MPVCVVIRLRPVWCTTASIPALRLVAGPAVSAAKGVKGMNMHGLRKRVLKPRVSKAVLGDGQRGAL